MVSCLTGAPSTNTVGVAICPPVAAANVALDVLADAAAASTFCPALMHEVAARGRRPRWQARELLVRQVGGAALRRLVVGREQRRVEGHVEAWLRPALLGDAEQCRRGPGGVVAGERTGVQEIQHVVVHGEGSAVEFLVDLLTELGLERRTHRAQRVFEDVDGDLGCAARLTDGDDPVRRGGRDGLGGGPVPSAWTSDCRWVITTPG